MDLRNERRFDSQDTFYLTCLYDSRAKPECVNELIMEKLTAPEEKNGASFEKTVMFIEKVKQKLTLESIEKIFLSKSINSFDSLRLVKPFVSMKSLKGCSLK